MYRFTILIASLLLIASPSFAFAQADNLPRFPGLLSEIRKADFVVRVTLTEASKWRDKPGGVAIVDGTVVDVYKGKFEPKQAIRFEVNVPGLRNKIDQYHRVFGEIDSLYYLPIAPWAKGSTGVFLIQAGKPMQVAAVLREDIGQPAKYVKLSRMSDADATLGLVKMLYDCTCDADKKGWYPFENTLLQDLRVNYKHLDTKGAGFRTFLADRKDATLRSLGESAYLRLDVAVWLTAHMDAQDRREGLKILLKAYDENAKLIDKLQATQKQQAGKAQGIAIDELTHLWGARRGLLGAMELIRDPAWTQELVNVRRGRLLLGKAYSYDKLDEKEVVAKVKAMVR